MLSLLSGVAAYVVTFAILLSCYHWLRNRRLAKRGPALAPRLKEKAKSNQAGLLLLATTLAPAGIVAYLHPCRITLSAEPASSNRQNISAHDISVITAPNRIRFSDPAADHVHPHKSTI